MVNRLPGKTITDSTIITHKITIAVTLVIVEDVLDVIKLPKRIRDTLSNEASDNCGFSKC